MVQNLLSINRFSFDRENPFSFFCFWFYIEVNEKFLLQSSDEIIEAGLEPEIVEIRVVSIFSLLALDNFEN
jgi:hypothetical protein